MSTKAELEARVAELEAELEATKGAPSGDPLVDILKEENEALKADNLALAAKLSLLEKNAGKKLPVITLNGQDYQFRSPRVAHKGRIYKAKEVAADTGRYAAFLEEVTAEDSEGKLKYGVLRKIK